MKKLLFYALMAMFAMPFAACEDGNEHMHDDDEGAEYHVHIMSPTTDDKKVGDMLAIEVEFDSETNQTVHHVNVRIYNKADETEIYNAPESAHVHEEDGAYTFTDELMLNADNNVEGHTDWVLEAKVWGHEAGKDEVTKSVEFHVHPN